jgi:hypothetical protein
VRKPMRKHKRTGERTGVLAKAATGVMRGRSTGAPAMFHVKPSGDNILYNQTYIRIGVQE